MDHHDPEGEDKPQNGAAPGPLLPHSASIIGVLELPVMVSVFNFYYRPVIWLYESTQLDELRTMA